MSTLKSSAENLTLNADGSGNDIKFQSNAVEVAEITDGGVISSTGGSTHADNVKAKFGTGNDLEIYHNASNSIIKDGGTGALAILASDFQVLNAADSEYMIRGVEDGAVNLYHNGAKKFNTASAGIELTGGIDITDGDIVFATAGKGICLGVTGNTDSNTLDDYEEGTFTPTIAFNGASVGMTFDDRNGYYTKIGRVVHASGLIDLSAVGSSTGYAKIEGLPFTSSGRSAASFTYVFSIAFSGRLGGQSESAATIKFDQTTDAGVNSDLQEGVFSNTTRVVFSITYKV